jgi:uncharacterized membrane protein YfcA
VGAFGLTTALSYAGAGLVNWPIAGLFVGGGVAGGMVGVLLAGRLAARRAMLTRLFAGGVLVVAAFILWKSAAAVFG